jgi:predicted heme/steroid binding protein
MDKKTRYLTQKELKEFDGKSGKPAYVAFKGKVYDVSQSHLWVNGDHTGRHFAVLKGPGRFSYEHSEYQRTRSNEKRGQLAAS